MSTSTTHNPQPITLYNTASRSLESFEPMQPGKVGIYSCGPTVYHYAHLGNLRATIFADTLRRVMEFNGYQITHVMNITDVGHLTSDADEGEDRLEKGAKRQGRTVWEVAKFYEEAFLADSQSLGNLEPTVRPRATEHIDEQIAMIKKLEANGYAYTTDQAVYYDVTKFPQYSDFSRQRLEENQAASRDIKQDPGKKHPADFALWMFTVGEHKDHTMRWPSPWGEGFPGWHIECSAMSFKYLGEEFDLHTGGIEHIGTHHTNEIAQSEGATGHKFVHYWLHNQHLTTAGEKMAKSAENFLRLQSIIDYGMHPLVYRYFCLTAHYRSELEFSWDALTAAQTSLKNLKREVGQWDLAETNPDKKTIEAIATAVNNDLDTPTALSHLWELVRSDLPDSVKRATVNKVDQLFGFGLHNYKQPSLTNEEQALVDQREQARALKQWAEADKLRDQLIQAGIELEDGASGVKAIKIGW